MNIIPSNSAKTPNYFCTWSAQGFDHEKPSISDWPRSITALTEDRLFGPGGWAESGVPQAARSSLYLLLDVGWDVEAEDYKSLGFGALGSGILSERKFSRLTRQGNASPVERLTMINHEAQRLGWRGVALWISPQVPGLSGDENATPEMIQAHFARQMQWSKEAGITYWKVDCGKNMMDNNFRSTMTDLGRTIAPELVLEHGRSCGPLNDEGVPWESLPGGRSGRFDKWVVTGGSVSAESAKLASFSDVFRTYDVTFNLSIATTLDRLNYLLTNTNVASPAQGLLNVEDEVYIAAALGCSMGVMRHPSWRMGDGLEYDSYNLRARMDEVTRAVQWQRISPAFGISETDVKVDPVTGTDVYKFGPGKSWVDWLDDETIGQSAPLRIARGCKLPLVIARNSSQVPFVVASRNPNGSISVATLPRTNPDLGIAIPDADIHLFIEDDAYSSLIGIFGNYGSLTIEFNHPLSLGSTLFAQDLLSKEAVNITSMVKWNSDQKSIELDGVIFEEICSSASSPGDISAPGLVLKIIP